MARRLRLQFPGAIYHLFNRGWTGQAVFATPERARAFVDCLALTCERLDWRVFAYSILRDEYHLAVQTPAPNLVEGMRWLQGTFATRRTRSGDGKGPQFDGRYHSVLIEPGEPLARVVDFIHMLPALRGVVGPEHLGLFRWGSLRALRRAPRPVWLDGPEHVEGWADGDGYEKRLQALVPDHEAQARRGFDAIGRGLTLGSAEWHRARETDHARLALDPKAPARQRALAYRDDWNHQLESLLAAAGRTRADAAADRKAARWKVELASTLRATSTATNAWIAEALSMGAPGAVSRYVGELRAERSLPA